uniref:DNA-directed RNA polymerase subunit beta'' n=2 Tax=Kappaphycus TaxID=38543 RepID=A0A2H4FGF3_9FLOR|nr:RNA polymerase beta'' subunit [Kappaphycus striatus]
MKKNILQPEFTNKVVDKNQLKQIIVWTFRNYGIARAANIADKLKDLGFHYATKAGISLSLEDLRIPPKKQDLLYDTVNSIKETDSLHSRGEITAVERFQKVIDTWNNASETLKQEVIRYFKNTDPLNAIYMMAFSGARGNISQVRQLVGMRGLMSDPQGQIIDLPISSNFREGLTITDYFISSYGARKGLVDTALRTADSGYLTRRLVDVAQDVIVRDVNCKTSKGILLEDMVENNKILIDLEHALLGRVLAEDILDPKSNVIIARSGQSVDPLLASQIVNSGYTSVLVRSPITCDSVGSVCQSCYGWNLAHGKMVDLGEAIGIIAAQSIGEPGTQLTMRTFHTGGVFTGELAQTIVSQNDVYVKYSDSIAMVESRTRHGDKAMLVTQNSKLELINSDGFNKFINLVKGTLVLVHDNTFVKAGQVIAEYPLSNRIITERAKKVIIADFSGSVHLEYLYDDKLQKASSYMQNTTKSGILWILSGTVYSIPDHADLMVSQNQTICEESLVARTQLISRYSGLIKILEKQNSYQRISILTSSKIFLNIQVHIDHHSGYNNHILEVDHNNKFILKTHPDQKIVHDQVIGELITDIYKTQTGGIIKYLDLPISKKKSSHHNDYYNILGSGYILWIPEETHEVNKDISLLLVKSGDFVDIGTEIIKNVFSNNSGIIETIQRDGIIREIIIKPGQIYSIENDYLSIFLSLGKYRGFLRPGEQLINGIITDKLVYWEYIKSQEQNLILIRPVIVYSVPSKNLLPSYTNDSFGTEMFNLQITRRIYFRDGARVKSIYGVDLLKTYIIAKLDPDILDMLCTITFVKPANKLYALLKLNTSDILSLKESSNVSNKNFYTKTLIKVQNGQYVISGSVIAQTEIVSNINGKINYIQKDSSSNRRLLITTSVDTRTFTIDNHQLVKVKVNDWVCAGDELVTGLITYYSGKIMNIQNNKILMWIGQPYLISHGSILHVAHNTLVRRGENIATLIFERAKTGDIIQGLPRIEEILEARKKLDNSFNPHTILESNFRFYLNQGLTVHDATRLSLLDTQLFLVKEIQLVYQSQKVDIADKHIEVIVRQMTSKVKIENGGDTDYLPGEIIELQKVELVNKSLSLIGQKEASYYPILLGITKASLNTESFISAASFQETTKVLTEAAISGKLDWLRGLKENVIIGRLIPAGTGFNIYNNSSLNEKNKVIHSHVNSSIVNRVKNNVSHSNFEDIILDDRIARNYPILLEEQKDNVNDNI